MTQAQMAKLFQTTPQNITMHVANVFDKCELIEEATCKDYLQVQTEGTRQVARTTKRYGLDVIIAAGYRVRSERGTQFCQWATTVLSEFMTKGFALDDEWLKEAKHYGEDYQKDCLTALRDFLFRAHEIGAMADDS